MTTLTVTDEGKVTLDRECLDLIHAKPGDQLDVLAVSDGRLQISAKRPLKKGGLEAFFGSIENKSGVHLTIDQIQEEIEKAWAGEP